MDFNSPEWFTKIAEKHERVMPLLQELADGNPTVISKSYEKSSWVHLNLSPTNPILAAMGPRNPTAFTDFINDEIERLGGKTGYGGVFEDRRWYQQSDVFGSGEEVRNLHIGLDVWVSAGVPVVCPIDGVIHSLKDNDQFLDYGPTIILEHAFKDEIFYSLYGHLSRQSLQDKEVGQKVIKGAEFAWIGSPPINGDWPPHLHFQLMLDMMKIKGDFPGVCSPSKRALYEAVCPNPMVLLGLK